LTPRIPRCYTPEVKPRLPYTRRALLGLPALASLLLLAVLVLNTRPLAGRAQTSSHPVQLPSASPMALPPRLLPHHGISFFDSFTGKSASKRSNQLSPDNPKLTYLHDLRTSLPLARVVWPVSALSTAPAPAELTPTPACNFAWSVTSSPNAPGSRDSKLFGMVATSPNSLWAVGRYVSNNIARTLALHWDDSQWVLSDSPNRGSNTANNLLIGVAGASSNDIWSVGYNDTPSGLYQTLTEHWDGTQWSIVPSPNYITTSNALRSISAISPNDVWAVGYYLETQGTFGFSRTLVEHWDGTQWSIVPSPNAGTDAELWDVSALSPNDIWAGGDYILQSGDVHTLVEHWDGIQWSIVPSSSSGYNNYFTGVSAIAANNAWLVGSYQAHSGASQTLIEHWNGSQLSVIPSPNLGPGFNDLLDISAISTNDIWAVGYYCCDSGNPSLTLAEHWDGTQWSIVSSPNPGNINNYLEGVSALSTGDVWAAGYTQGCGSTGCPWLTLTEHYTTVCTTPTQSPTGTPTRTATQTPTVTYTASNTPPATSTATVTPTRTPSIPITLTVSPTMTPTGIGSATITATASVIDTATSTPPLNATPTVTSTACSMTFSDVQSSDYFYQPVLFLYCRGVISGYADNTYRPYNNTTRGQLTKIVVLGFGLPIYTLSIPTFNDVPTTDPFYQYVETAYHASLVSGYDCGGAGEPCPGLYYRPGNNVTRGQLCKIVVLAAGWPLLDPPTATFRDVPLGSTFYRYVETAYNKGIITGYGCGTNCLEFRPGNSATRGQIAKIVYQAIAHP
jgi:hypothetical protein